VPVAVPIEVPFCNTV
jgi:hypothetical protein